MVPVLPSSPSFSLSALPPIHLILRLLPHHPLPQSPVLLSNARADPQPHSTLHLWSAGNIRLSSGRDLTVPIQESTELIKAMERDARVSISSALHPYLSPSPVRHLELPLVQ